VALDLIDTGCGMDENTAMHMFDAFYSTKEDGSGLGLPTAKKVIEAHGARIVVQSEVGRGTQFTLEFPTPPRLAGGAAGAAAGGPASEQPAADGAADAAADPHPSSPQ
jgi:nitrogen-specific signal transduction histidine kinase